MEDQKFVQQPKRVAGSADTFVSMGGDRTVVREALKAGERPQYQPPEEAITMRAMSDGQKLFIVRFDPMTPSPVMHQTMKILRGVLDQLGVDRVAIIPLAAGLDIEELDQIDMNDMGWFRREQFPTRGAPIPPKDSEALLTDFHAALLAHWTLEDHISETESFLVTLSEAGLVVTKEKT